MSISAAAIYSGAAFVGIIESLLPGGEEFSVLPAAAALVLSALIVFAGPHLPRLALAALGPLGAAMIGVGHRDDHRLLGRRRALHVAGGLDGLLLRHAGAPRSSSAGSARCTAPCCSRCRPSRATSTAGSTSSWRSSWSPSSCGRWPPATSGWSAKLEDEARVDPLTGLLNRRGLEERLDAELARAARDGSPLGAVAFDLDHFKRVNDEHGHEIGDRVLVWLGALLKEQARGVDVAARVGGEEFVVLLPRADHEAGRVFAERVRLAVEAGGQASGRGRAGLSEALQLTVSAGVASADAPVDGQALLAEADRALYAAKRHGRNRTNCGPRAGGARAVSATA